MIHAYLFSQSSKQEAGWVIFVNVVYQTGERERIMARLLPSMTGNAPTPLRFVEATSRAYLAGLRAAHSVSRAVSAVRFPGNYDEPGPVVSWHTFPEEAPNAPANK